ncbi:MAG: class I SAM-dependent methyltransferase [Prosthecobacter sp.]|jgi:SAM-dependent methyltransferase|uniref:class I SAM-dependent methyltransferase n=1 Tax=Prosthecobacter sp. TaxID=1965333 RepID=UPI0019F27202|nr:class I SAM-dependent methyltransferase [Prosthecobacter sp.]MBE2285264.1 class I SAM-dependent methyltransferase [Prosthecobacter sp.]
MSFDLLAPHYRWMEAVFAGGRLQRCRTALLGTISPPRNVLIYGEGNGRFLCELLRRFPEAQVTVVEASGVMIQLARERLRNSGLARAAVRFVQADALEWMPPAASFDFLVTCFFLDCFREDELRRLMPQIASAATSDARWLVADFQIAGDHVWCWRNRMIVRFLYAFFRWATHLSGRALIDPTPSLHAAGFVRVQRLEMSHRLLSAELWSRESQPSCIPRIT